MSIDIVDLFAGVAIGTIAIVIIALVFIPVIAFFIAMKIVKPEKNGSFGQILLTYVIMILITAVVNLIPGGYGIYLSCLALIGEIFLIKERHKLSFGNALIVMILYIVMLVIIILAVIFLVLGGIGAIMSM